MVVYGKSFRIDELGVDFEASYWVEDDFNGIFHSFFYVLYVVGT